jgi:enterochelin esterase-like enzyme
MIPTKRLLFLFFNLTLILLVACEPLAPEQKPAVIVVTGETPINAMPIAVDVTLTPTGQGIVGPIETVAPSETPLPTITMTPSTTPFVCSQTEGRIIESSFTSTITGEEIPFHMYQPPCFYESLKRYPYVVLLHGTGYDETMWEELGVAVAMDQGISKGTLPPMVLILPDGNPLSEVNDAPEDETYENLLLDELLPMLEQDFCLWGARQGRSLGGISRGGFWSFSIALRHPELFNAVGGHSPFFDPENSAPETNPLSLAEHVNLDKYPLRIYMDNAANDVVGTNVLLMSDILRGRNIDHEYVINPTGEHDMDYWRSHVAEYLTFYGQGLPYDVGALPSCLEPSPQ